MRMTISSHSHIFLISVNKKRECAYTNSKKEKTSEADKYIKLQKGEITNDYTKTNRRTSFLQCYQQDKT